MRTTLRLVMALALAPAVSWGAAPDSIVGTWQLDIVRTITEHMDRLAQSQPDAVSVESLKSAKASLSEREGPSPIVMLTITETEIISQGPQAEPATTPYTLIGGNSALVIVEFIDDEGYESVSHIRLVEGGIAVEPMNCRENPKLCERQRKRAVEHQKKSQAISSTIVEADAMTLSASGSSTEQSTSDLSGSLDRPPQPRWFYFKPAE